MVNLDLFGPLPIAAGGHRYILINVDHLTKWVNAASSSSASVKISASFLLRHVFSHQGSPRVLISDNRFIFFSQIVTELSNLFGTFPSFAAPYHPATNGAIKKLMDPLSPSFSRWIPVIPFTGLPILIKPSLLTVSATIKSLLCHPLRHFMDVPCPPV